MPPVIDPNRCTLCGQCVELCPEDVFFGSDEKSVPQVSYPDDCWHCNSCVYECPSDAIKLRIPLPMMMLFKPRNEE